MHWQCRHPSISRDDVTGSLVCESCGTVQRFDNYHAATWSADGPQGVFIRVGGSGTGSVLNYGDKKIFEANNLIDDITFKLDLISRRSEIKAMISKITQCEFGTGDWFRVLIGACAYVVVRSANKSLSIAEIGDVIGRDVHELGRMIARVVEHLGLELPEFDIVGSFEKVLRNLSSSGRIEGDKVERMREQGVFLIQCATKWFLTTGRRPLPIVAAVLVLVAELNGVPGMKIEEMARRVHAAVSTSKTRYRELLEAIVKAAQVLPWGKDVTVKNAVKNAPFVLRHMEMKLMAKDNEEECLGSGDFDLEEVVSQCLRKEVEYGIDVDATKSDESRYFEVGNDSNLNDVVVDFDKLQLSHECLSMAYDKFLKEVGCGKFEGVTEKGQRGKSKRGVELHPAEWWNGKTELSKKLLLKQILEKDVGLNPMPPSFVNGVMAVERRQAKISAAKSRIEKIMHPDNADLSDTYEICVPEDLHARKKKRKTCAKDIDWEDFVIETLLLHQLALTYNKALLSGRLTTSRGGVVQSVFLGSLKKKLDELLSFSENLKNDLWIYLNTARWPNGEKNSVLLSWYLQWYGVRTPSVIWMAMEKIKPKQLSSSLVPLLHLLFPTTHINAIGEIDKCLLSSQRSG